MAKKKRKIEPESETSCPITISVEGNPPQTWHGSHQELLNLLDNFPELVNSLGSKPLNWVGYDKEELKEKWKIGWQEFAHYGQSLPEDLREYFERSSVYSIEDWLFDIYPFLFEGCQRGQPSVAVRLYQIYLTAISKIDQTLPQGKDFILKDFIVNIYFNDQWKTILKDLLDKMVIMAVEPKTTSDKNMPSDSMASKVFELIREEGAKWSNALSWLLRGTKSNEDARQSWCQLVWMELKPLLSKLDEIEKTIDEKRDLDLQQLHFLENFSRLGKPVGRWYKDKNGVAFYKEFSELPEKLDVSEIRSLFPECQTSFAAAALLLMCSPANRIRKRLEQEDPLKEISKHPYLFRKLGSIWFLAFNEKHIALEDYIGLTYIQILVQHQGQLVTNDGLDRIRIERCGKTIPSADSDSFSSDEYPSSRHQQQRWSPKEQGMYKAQIVEIKDDIEKAKRNNDQGLIDRLEKDKRILIQQAADASGVVNENKTDKRRRSIGKAISDAIDKIQEAQFPELAEHLKTCIKGAYSGSSRSYSPPEFIDWHL
jgi:hypothetical protein